VLLCAILAVLVATGCGSATTATTTGSRHGASAHAGTAGSTDAPARPATLAYRSLYQLAAPVRDPAFAALGDGRFVLLGGLDSSISSTATIALADVHGVLRTASLPAAQHDAQAAQLGGEVYVFGGGTTSELDHIVSFDPSRGAVGAVGALPRGQSDVAVTATGGTAYVIGGYDGTSWLSTILAWRPGSAPRVVGNLPVGLRYAATTAIDGQILIIGGSAPDGASNAIYRFDPATGTVREIGRLPQPITHASAATLGSFVYLVGGRGNSLDSQTAGIWSINPRTGAVATAGRLPEPLSDTAALTIGGTIVVAGGQSPASVAAGVGELVPQASG
jgi:N-acetylneuraminic acid mutarotase